jgi:hypothetical protein
MRLEPFAVGDSTPRLIALLARTEENADAAIQLLDADRLEIVEHRVQPIDERRVAESAGDV